jgi:hypothetical protein
VGRVENGRFIKPSPTRQAESHWVNMVANFNDVKDVFGDFTIRGFFYFILLFPLMQTDGLIVC